MPVQKQKIPIRSIPAKKKNPAISGNFRIQKVSDLLAGRDMTQELHRHDFFFILVLEKGSGTHEIDFASYKITNHTVFFLRPGQVHQLTLHTKSIGYLVEFKPNFFFPHDKTAHQLLRSACHNNYDQLDADPFKKISALLTSMFEEYTHHQERHQEVIRALLNIFLIELVRNRKTSKDLLPRATTYTQERLEEFQELLEKHAHEHHEVSYYAGQLNLSTYQLNAITKERIGKTSSQLINDYILLEARRYLLATTDQVSQIAYHLGYEDVSYFIRFFRKHTGHSPEVFRQIF